MNAVVIVNPLGAALAHYTDALAHDARLGGARVTRYDLDEPSASGRSAGSWVLSHWRTLLCARRTAGRADATIVVTWPVLGYLDLVVCRLLFGRRRWGLVVHDPRPLVRATGHSALARRLAAVAAGPRNVLVHSTVAAADVLADVGIAASRVDHPVMPAAGPDVPAPAPADRVVRVLGQYKAERDTDVMERIAQEAPGGVRFEVHGRGWPAIPGWDVHDDFIPEDRLDEVIRTASCVLVPYRRFYQSGIAVRAAEHGTPFVGPADSSLADMLPAGSGCLVDDVDDVASWLDAVDVAVEQPVDRGVAVRQATDRAVRSWRRWLVGGER